MKIGIVGLGLIGGSLGLKLQSLNHTVYGIANNKVNEKGAKDRQLANFVSCDLGTLKDCSLILLTLPIKDLINPCPELIKAIPKNAIVTDVGSIKEPIIRTWEKIHPLFIGSHPMAGTEKKGVHSGFADLFTNAKWIVTPTQKTDAKSIKILSKLILSMGCEICEASPRDHDEAVSLISHLPIFLASALIETAHTENKSLLDLTKKIAASGFADTSRVGGGNPELTLDLATNNKKQILKAIKIFKGNINKFESLIKEENWGLLSQQLSNLKNKRESFID